MPLPSFASRPAPVLLLLVVACGNGAEDAPPSGSRAPVASVVEQAGDTIRVTTPEPGLVGPFILDPIWELAADPLHVGIVHDAALGLDRSIWLVTSGGTEPLAVQRIGTAGVLEPVVRRGTTAGQLDGAVHLIALAGSGVLAIETETGRAVRIGEDGVPADTLRLRPLTGGGAIHPDRFGGWFQRSADGSAWLRHGPDGSVTDTLPVPAAWRDDAPAVLAVGRDGSLLRAAPGADAVDRRAGTGTVVRSAWGGDAIIGTPQLGHDLADQVWLGDRIAGGPERWRAFDRDGALRFAIELPARARILDRDGEYLLAFRDGLPPEGGLVVWQLTRPRSELVP